jgi:hypothetical protein
VSRGERRTGALPVSGSRDGQIFIRILIPSQEVKFPDPGRRVRKLLCKYMYRRDSSSVYDPVFLHDP